MTQNPSLRLAYDEARVVLGRQVGAIDDIDDKAARVMTLAATLIGAVTAGVALLNRDQLAQGVFANGSWATRGSVVLIAVGDAALAFCIGFATATYSKRDIAAGLRPEDFEDIASRDLTEREYLSAALNAYSEGLRQNALLDKRAASRLKVTLASFVLGLACVTVGGIGLIGRLMGFYL